MSVFKSSLRKIIRPAQPQTNSQTLRWREGTKRGKKNGQRVAAGGGRYRLSTKPAAREMRSLSQQQHVMDRIPLLVLRMGRPIVGERSCEEKFLEALG